MKMQSTIREYMKEILTHHLKEIGENLHETQHLGDKVLVSTLGSVRSCFVILSSRQTIRRIPTQVDILLREYDHVIIFTIKKLRDIENLLPEEVGLMIVDLQSGDRKVIIIR
jgi:hypothetical protein